MHSSAPPMPAWPRPSASTLTSQMPARRLWLTRSTPATDPACVSSRRRYWPSENGNWRDCNEIECRDGNRTLLSFLNMIGRSADRTRENGQEAPRDAVTGQRYWPSIGLAPPNATRLPGVPASGERTGGCGGVPPIDVRLDPTQIPASISAECPRGGSGRLPARVRPTRSPSSLHGGLPPRRLKQRVTWLVGFVDSASPMMGLNLEE